MRNGVRPRRSGRGMVLVYTLVLMTAVLAVTSLAVDYGRMQQIKTQLQRDADATARGTLQMWVDDGQATTNTCSPWMATNTWNPVDDQSGVAQTVVITWGYWNASAHAFVAGTGSPTAVQVTVSRTAANGNPVPLTFPLIGGAGAGPVRTSCDISATATAVLTPAQTINPTVPGTADLWLAGMPTGSTASYDDTESNSAPTLAALPVTPGSVLTFTATGVTSNTASNPILPPNGSSSSGAHMSGSPDGNYNGCQNGIQSITTPIGSLLGVFLTNAQPSTRTPPATALNYSTSAARNQPFYQSLQTQQPFYVGGGQNSGGTTQSFVVPPGATRLYLGVFDTYENNNNAGSLVVSVTLQARVTLVQ